MNTSITKSQGFTLVEMLIVVAIIGILSTIAYPSYIHYIERGYQSQAHTELLAINNALKTKLVKNPTLKIEDEIEGDTGLVKTYKAAPEVAAKYDFSGEMKKIRTLKTAGPIIFSPLRKPVLITNFPFGWIAWAMLTNALILIPLNIPKPQ